MKLSGYCAALTVAVLAAAGSGTGHAAAAAQLPDYRAIALRVAGAGLPQCRSRLADGRDRPCLPGFAVRRGNGVNGWSQNGWIEFSEGAVRRLSADEFALLAGHEIAHWYLGHNGSNPVNELAADRLGALLACQAGFDVAAGAGLFRYLRKDRFHPERRDRIAAVLDADCGASARPAEAITAASRSMPPDPPSG